MQRCLDLAQMGAGTVSPNPMVGAVIVHAERIIGEGYTSPYGGPHAEVNAVQSVILRLGEQEARRLFRESTIYVSLEPCAHQGKTPPCADMLVEMGFRKAVVAVEDPFAKVNGEGIKKLKDAGMEVVVGVLEQEARWLNRRFFTRVSKFRPYVILKWAETKDGYFAPLDHRQQWISNAASKQLVHQWRAEEDAVLVGFRTAQVDNPSLTVREWKGRNPVRIVIDQHLELPPNLHIFDQQADTIVFNAKKTDWTDGVKHIEVENFELYLPQNILYQLYLMDIQSIIIEGGVQTLQRFIDADLWDEARVFSGQQEWGEGLESPVFKGTVRSEQKVADNTLTEYVNNNISF